ncbi:MAG: ECF transporter S component [Nitrososphaeria archaeon]|nr:ECF transporter S component [Nitrososphaeria archaeon]
MKKAILILSLIALILITFSTFMPALETIRSIGFEGVFTNLSLTEVMKFSFSSYLTFTLSALGANLIIVLSLRKGYITITKYTGIILTLLTIILLYYQFSGIMSSNILYMSLLSLSTIFTIATTVYSFREKEVKPIIKPLTIKEIAYVSVFSALTAVLTVSTGGLIPSPTGGFTHIGDTIIFFAALLMGSRCGMLVGSIGSVAADIFLAYPRWYVSIPAHGFEGLIAGLGKDKPLWVKIVFLIIGGFIMASTYFIVNIFIKGYPLAVISYFRDLFGQAGISIILSIILEKIVKARIKLT